MWRISTNTRDERLEGDTRISVIHGGLLAVRACRCDPVVIEARKHGVKFVWLYIVGGYVIALSVTFPLFLIAREVRMDTSDARGLRKTDLALLVVVAALGAVQIIWVLTV